jgi:hypothetical protein
VDTSGLDVRVIFVWHGLSSEKLTDVTPSVAAAYERVNAGRTSVRDRASIDA